MNKGNNNWFEILIATAFLLVIFLASLPYSWWPKSQTFDPDVWGTVSDWAMVIVTGGTLYYLYQTLQSQIAVQKEQQLISKIESYRQREAILPKFMPDFEKPIVYIENGDIVTDVICKVYPSKRVKNVKLYYIQAKDNIRHDVSSTEYIINGTHYKISFKFRLGQNVPRNVFNSTIDIFIEYNDDMKNPYIQQINVGLVTPNQIIPIIDEPRYLGDQ